jgi:hypothetical protein
VYPNSPAAQVGLKAGTDYVIATPDTLLQDQASFADLIEQNLNKDLRLYVYSSETNQTREVKAIFFLVFFPVDCFFVFFCFVLTTGDH